MIRPFKEVHLRILGVMLRLKRLRAPADVREALRVLHEQYLQCLRAGEPIQFRRVRQDPNRRGRRVRMAYDTKDGVLPSVSRDRVIRWLLTKGVLLKGWSDNAFCVEEDGPGPVRGIWSCDVLFVRVISDQEVRDTLSSIRELKVRKLRELEKKQSGPEQPYADDEMRHILELASHIPDAASRAGFTNYLVLLKPDGRWELALGLFNLYIGPERD